MVIHRPLHDYSLYVGSGLVTVTSEGVMLLTNGGKCYVILSPPSFMGDSVSIPISLDGEPTPF